MFLHVSLKLFMHLCGIFSLHSSWQRRNSMNIVFVRRNWKRNQRIMNSFRVNRNNSISMFQEAVTPVFLLTAKMLWDFCCCCARNRDEHRSKKNERNSVPVYNLRSFTVCTVIHMPCHIMLMACAIVQLCNCKYVSQIKLNQRIVNTMKMYVLQSKSGGSVGVFFFLL